MIQTEHSIEYLTDDYTTNWSRFKDPISWLLNYVSRNKIPVEFFDYPMDKFVNGKTKPYIRVYFRSQHQCDIFVRKANDLFPYVEFI